MKKLLLSMLLLVLGTTLATAQVPPYSTSLGTIANTIPLNNTSVIYEKSQYLYAPGEIGGAINGLIDTLWIRVGTASGSGYGVYSNFEVSMGQSLGTATAFPNTNMVTGLTSVLSSANYNTQPTVTVGSDHWLPIPLTTSFGYDASQSLIVEIKSDAGVSSGVNVFRGNSTDRRLLSSYSATTGTLFTGPIDIGLSIEPQVFPPAYTSLGTIGNSIPFNNSTAIYAKSQYLYTPGEIAGDSDGFIDTLWIRCSTNQPSGAGVYSNLSIAMGQSLGTATAFPSTNFITGLTNVLNEASYTTLPIITIAGSDWLPIPLSTPFAYDDAQSLVVEIKCDPSVANGTNVFRGTATDRRLIGSLASSSGTLFGGPIDIGLSISPGITPPYYTTLGTIGNTIPLNNSSSIYERSQYLYAPGEMPGAINGSIDTLWVRCGTNQPSGAGVYSNLTISLGQSLGTATAFPNTTMVAGLTNVLNESSYTTLPIVTVGGSAWLPIPLTTSFPFDPSLSLIVEFQSDAGVTNGTNVFRGTAADRRLLSTSNAPTGTLFAGPIDLGISIDNSPFTPPFYNSNTANSTTSFPLNNTTTDKTQYIYGPGLFSGANDGIIDTLWLRAATNEPVGAGPFTDLEISMGQTIGTSTTLSNTFFTGLTTVFYDASYTTVPISTAVPQDGWFAIPLNTPFHYDPNQSLVVELKHQGTGGNGVTMRAALVSASDGGRIYGQYANATGTSQAVHIDLGFNLTPCNAPIPEILYYKYDGNSAVVPNLASSPPAGAANAAIVGSQTQGGAGQYGTALIGTGNSGNIDYVNTNWNLNLGTSDWTISFWTAGNDASTSLSYFFGANPGSSFRCFTNGTAGQDNVILRGPGVTDVLITGGADANPHVNTFVYDSTAGEIRAYLDGNLVNTVAQGSPLNLTGTSPFKVGGYAGSMGLMNGARLDEFGVYNRALSESEVQSLMNGIPLAVTTATPSTLCSGDTVKLTATSTNPQDVILWYDAAIGGNLVGTSASGDTLSLISSTAQTTYYSQVIPAGSYGVDTFSFTGTIDTFTVPTGVTEVMVHALGAEGGGTGTTNIAPGLGASIFGTVSVTPGQGLRVLVGEQPNTANGGGGGSFVTDYSNSPIVIAGGGGGGSAVQDSSTKHGQAGTTGGYGAAGGAAGGTGGNGGMANGTAPFLSGAGGGLLTDGADGTQPSSGGNAFVNGGAATGGFATGGFGGGGRGSGSFVGGGGGGYSGGGAAGNEPSAGNGAPGGGGGSFNAGVQQANLAGVHSGDGMIIFRWITGPGCDSPASRNQVTIVVNETPAAPTVTAVDPTCATGNGTIDITAPLGSGIEYSVDGINYQSGTSFAEPAGTYSVTARNVAGGCTSEPTSVTLNPNPTPCVVNITCGALSTPSSIGQGNSATINYFVVNSGNSPSNDTIRVLISKPVNGTSSLTLPPGWTIESSNASSFIIVSADAIQPGLINRVTIPSQYLHNGTNETAVRIFNIFAQPGSGGETNGTDNQSQTFVQIN